MTRITQTAAVALALTLFACGGSSDGTDNTPAPAPSSTTFGAPVTVPQNCSRAATHDSVCAASPSAASAYTCPTGGHGDDIVAVPTVKGCGDANSTSDPNVAVVCCP